MQCNISGAVKIFYTTAAKSSPSNPFLYAPKSLSLPRDNAISGACACGIKTMSSPPGANPPGLKWGCSMSQIGAPAGSARRRCLTGGRWTRAEKRSPKMRPPSCRNRRRSFARNFRCTKKSNPRASISAAWDFTSCCSTAKRSAIACSIRRSHATTNAFFIPSMT